LYLQKVIFFILSSIHQVEILVINANNQKKTMSRIRIYFLRTPTQNLLTTVKITTLKDRNPLSFEEISSKIFKLLKLCQKTSLKFSKGLKFRVFKTNFGFQKKSS
jgi:hypothetical protein